MGIWVWRRKKPSLARLFGRFGFGLRRLRLDSGPDDESAENKSDDEHLIQRDFVAGDVYEGGKHPPDACSKEGGGSDSVALDDERENHQEEGGDENGDDPLFLQRHEVADQV